MTKNSNSAFKKAVRRRMTDTDETYMQASAAFLADRGREESADLELGVPALSAPPPLPGVRRTLQASAVLNVAAVHSISLEPAPPWTARRTGGSTRPEPWPTFTQIPCGSAYFGAWDA